MMQTKTAEEIYESLERSRKQAQNNQVKDVDEFIQELRKKYGL